MPFDGNPGPVEHGRVASSKWWEDEGRLRKAAQDLSVELGRFERGKLAAREVTRLRRVIELAAQLGIVEREAEANARRIAVVAWSIVVLRFQRPEPAYPKAHRESAVESYAERRLAWESSLIAEIRSSHRVGVKQVGVSDLSRLRAALSRGRGPRPTGLLLAHRVFRALAEANTLPMQPRATVHLTAPLRALLLAVAAQVVTPKTLPTKTINR